MSSKNQLQEYFQKNKRPLPQYITKLCGGQPHCPEFTSTVSIEAEGPLSLKRDFGRSPVLFTSDIFSSKREAELNVASKALAYISKRKAELDIVSNQEIEQYKKPLHFDHVVLIDLENIPQAKDFSFSDNLFVIGFMSSSCSAYSQIKSYKNLMQVEIIKSAIKDAADILLIFSLARIIYSENLSKQSRITIIKSLN